MSKLGTLARGLAVAAALVACAALAAPSTAQDKKACEAGDGSACVAFAQSLSDDVAAKPAAPRESPYQHGCDVGNSTSCLMLAYDYEEGKTVPRDLKKANEFFQKACDLGSPEGCSKSQFSAYSAFLYGAVAVFFIFMFCRRQKARRALRQQARRPENSAG